MTEAMPFLQKTILLSYDPRPFLRGYFFACGWGISEYFYSFAFTENLCYNIIE